MLQGLCAKTSSKLPQHVLLKPPRTMLHLWSW